MKTILLSTSLVLLTAGTFWAQAPEGYYSEAEGLEHFHLKNQLHKIISKDNISWNYGDLVILFEITDRDSFYENDGSILDLYSENPDGPDPYNYTFEENSLISGAGTEGLGWNREHVVSQSFFKGEYPMYSDMHFVMPTDARVNQRRSNYPIAKVNSSPTFTSLTGNKVGLSASPGYTLTVFEPIDEFKGDFARMLMYAAVRYENLLPFFDTTNTRNPFDSRQEQGLKPWQVNVMMEWHLADPVSEREIARNNKIFEIQGNRNPFIDHPEFAAMIWTVVEDVTPPEEPIYLEVDAKGSKFIQIKWAETSAGDVMGYQVYLGDSLAGITHNRFFALSQLSPSTSYTFTVRAYDAAYNLSEPSLPLTVSTTDTDTFATDLYFTKIIEGSGYNTAIEITNRTGYTVDLREYIITKREINTSTGSLYWSDNGYQMDGYLAHGQKVVLVHPNWTLPCFDKSDADFVTAGTPLRFDGRTALRLYRGNTGIDIFGSSSDTAAFAENASVYRKPESNQPSNSFLSSDWVWHPQDYCDSLGNVDEVDTSSSIAPTSVDRRFEIYPNPVEVSTDIFVVQQGYSHIKEVVWYDLLGREIERAVPLSAPTTKIKVPEVPAGLYLLSLDGELHRVSILSK